MVPNTFVVSATNGAAPFASPAEITSDFDTIGPTGPDACGTCYPTNRTPHSYDYGPNGGFCPSPAVLTSGGACNSEWRWEAAVKFPISVEDASWGQIKNLYR